MPQHPVHRPSNPICTCCGTAAGLELHLAPPTSLLVALAASSLGAGTASGPPLLGRRTSSFGASPPGAELSPVQPVYRRRATCLVMYRRR